MAKNKKKEYSRVLVYQYPFYAIKSEEGFIWTPNTEEIDKLFLGMTWKPIIESWLERKDLYFGFEIRGESDVFPVMEGKVELEINSLSNPCMSLEMAVMPSKLDPIKRELLNALFTTYQTDEDFVAFWDDDPKDPGSRQTALKKKIRKSLDTIPVYKGENSINSENADVTPIEALQFFGYNKDNLPSEEDFKKKLREFQLKYHPDANEGDEKQFRHLQKCRKLLEEFLE